ncbi:MAG TPA: YbdD/YjiX family protein [Gemmatimonadales bacterium]|nr:YbdD/YjiX family protein [Gemmatimonadales bacterium]
MGPRRPLERFLRALRQIVGAPDYARYLEHHAACHPHEPPLSPREHYAEFVRRRFGGGVTRCC